jgi:hypothetical protein
MGLCEDLFTPKIKTKINITIKDINLTTKTAIGTLVAKI